MKTNTTVCAIVATGPYDIIGQGGRMPWYSCKDFYHFKTVTTPYPCIFGKSTYMSLPKRPLPMRLNIVCSSQYKNEFVDSVFYADSVESAIAQCKNYDYVFICGGYQIYKYVLFHDLIDVLYLTKIYDEDLASNARGNIQDYIRFPCNTDTFLYSNRWVAKKMIYPPNILPIEYSDVKTEFFKCIRAR